MKVKNYSQALNFLYQQVPRGVKRKFPGALGLARTKAFLKLLNNPQNKIKVIHIAGTSGKGSTAYLISIILKSLGFKVGLHISPHLLDIRERVQINNHLINQKKFVYYLNKLMPFIDKMKQTKFGLPTYFEVIVCLAFYVFYDEGANYAVIETGMGGQYDATNSISNKNKLAVITKIGLDHTKILGNNLKKIARQKAKIIQNRNPVISLWQKNNINQIIQKQTKISKSNIFFVKKNFNYKNYLISKQNTIFDFKFLKTSFKKINLGLLGWHQIENCSLALTTVIVLSLRDKFDCHRQKIYRILKTANFPGRLEIINLNNQSIIIDGAHNPQKMASLAESLKIMFSENKYNFLIAFKQGKDYNKMLKYITPKAKKIIITKFFINNQDLSQLSENPRKIENSLNQLNYKKYQIINHPKKALNYCLSLNKNPLVITGSLYFLGEVYKSIIDYKKSVTI